MDKSLLLAVYVLLCIVISIIAFGAGYLLRYISEKRKITREPPKLNQEDEIKLKKDKREYENFMTYNGDEQ